MHAMMAGVRARLGWVWRREKRSGWRQLGKTRREKIDLELGFKKGD